MITVHDTTGAVIGKRFEKGLLGEACVEMYMTKTVAEAAGELNITTSENSDSSPLRTWLEIQEEKGYELRYFKSDVFF